jgi:hypothetical protein
MVPPFATFLFILGILMILLAVFAFGEDGMFSVFLALLGGALIIAFLVIVCFTKM